MTFLFAVWANGARADAFPDTISFDGFEPCGIKCQRATCGAGATTSLSGIVNSPNGLLPLPNVEVYLASSPLATFVDGPNAPRCDEAPSGHPILATLTGTDGRFRLDNVPVAPNLQIVVLAGKWRRVVPVPSVTACVDNPLDVDKTRLPATHLEGDIPRTAIVTGAADAIECLVRKTGVADSEFGLSSSAARFHLYVGNGTAKSAAGTFANATTLWASSASLSAYDQVMAGCEGDQQSSTIPQVSINAMKTYADSGGRAYFVHWQNIWLAGSISGPQIGAWPTAAAFDFTKGSPINSSYTATVLISDDLLDQFAQWLLNTSASNTLGSVALIGPYVRHTAITANAPTRPWMSVTTEVTTSQPLLTFTTPFGGTPAAQRGRVLFADLHGSVGDGSNPAATFPTGDCATSVTSLTPQDQLLLYGVFDLQRCVDSSRE
ncbi:MAG TPA: hypothetical protein VLK26_01155 [Rudaea sp.]|nr:hypothetical protein [Rudaea sp.]